MYDPDSKKGVLTDFDLATIDNSRPGARERTGIVPFMVFDLPLTAAEMARNVEHLYRHDSESFAWVFLWICGRY